MTHSLYRRDRGWASSRRQGYGGLTVFLTMPFKKRIRPAGLPDPRSFCKKRRAKK